MNATLWVIWIALAVLLFCVGLTIGSQCFPSEQRLDGAWRDGYERGCDDELASCAPCDRPHAPPWDDTADALAERAAPYYEPLVRADGNVYGVPILDAPDFVFVPANPGPPPATIFDDLITCWPQLATPLDSPPGGVAPEPSAPAPGTVMGAGPDNPGSWQPGAEVKPPAPELAPGRDVPGHDPGAGAEFTLTQALADPDPIFGALDDTGVFALIEFELRHLKVLAAEGFKLTPWKEART